MHIILAAPRGFCAGVNMAIASLDEAIARYGVPVYVYHEIVHNRWVVERFQRQGVVFVDHLDEVPVGATLVFSAHGVAPEVRRRAEARQLHVIDATCPLVTKVHREAVRLASEECTIVLIGHAGHDEVVGTLGEAPESILLVQTLEDVDRIDLADSSRIAYLTQTTLSVTDAEGIIRRLKQRFPEIVGPPSNDICYATQNRQTAVRELSREADLVLVVGSRNSSNSRRLAELGQAAGVPSYLVDGPGDICDDWLAASHTVLITAGASAPEDVVQECVSWLEKRFHATVAERTICDEQVRFSLPPQLREPE
jgi:4-hydroxy-3-methylbut-2-en-1-yl diphosphate reductase